MLDTPTASRGQKQDREMPQRPGYGYPDDLSVDDDDDFDLGPGSSGDRARRRKRGGVKLRIAGLMPKAVWGRVAVVFGSILIVGGAAAGAWLGVRSVILHDEHFVMESADSIQVAGNSRMSRAQLLSVFGGDVERNVFTVPLDDRRAQLEALPWVQGATVMRLLPNRIRVAIVERTPVAFVRQGREIGLVDASGVMLDMDSGAGSSAKNQGYSFPVLTGITQTVPLSTRAARMRIYQDFVKALDADDEHVSEKLSEVDLSNPEDVRALIAEDSGPEVMVHFGDEKYLERYHSFRQHLPEWRQQYPKLASADMRYERQVVLEMQPGASAGSSDVASAAAKPVVAAAPALAVKKPAVIASAKPKGPVVAKAGSVAKPVVRPASAAHIKPVAKSPAKSSAAAKGAAR